MTDRTWKRIATALAVAAALAACGDGGSSGSGVDGDKTLDQLSDDEAVDLCEWSSTLISDEELTRFGCYFAALLVSESRDQCEDLAQQCIDDAEPDEGIECVADGDLPECASQVTVAEIEDCTADTIDQVEDIAGDISCDTDPQDIFTIDQPPSCIEIEDKCPELFDDDEEDPSSPG